MKYLPLFLCLSFLFVSILSCTKNGGCTDPTALNYIWEAKAEVDDGSCTYPSKVRIKFVHCKSFPTVNNIGSAWDASDNPDTFLRIEDEAGNIIFQGELHSDNSQEFAIDEISPILTVDNLYQVLTVSLYDKDDTVDELMGLTSIDLNDYTHYGTKTEKYPFLIESSYAGFTFELSGIEWE